MTLRRTYAFALIAFNALAVHAQTDNSGNLLKEDTPRTGTLIKKNIIASSQISMDKTYAQLSDKEKKILDSRYESMGPGDEPPFPKTGLKSIFKAIQKLDSSFQEFGTLDVVVDVGSDGKATSVSILKTPDSSINEAVSAVFMLTPYKAALCKGVPCKMQFPFSMSLMNGNFANLQPQQAPAELRLDTANSAPIFMTAENKKNQAYDVAAQVKIVSPEYPRGSLMAKEYGIVKVEMAISASGALTASKIIHSSGFEKLDLATLATVEKAKFVAAQKDNQPVDSILQVDFNWKLPDFKLNYEHVVEAAKNGDAKAQNDLGVCYQRGYGVGQDDEMAVIWYRKSADQGNSWAQNNLGYMYRTGAGVEKNETMAAEWLSKSAAQNNSWAQFSLGMLYYEGRGVAKDLDKAVTLIQQSANSGYARAQAELAYFYSKGTGVPLDNEMAVSWYIKAADQGDSGAQSNLGYMYRRGFGVAQDDKQAIYWYTKSAAQGNYRGQGNLGEMYLNGWGVDVDKTQAEMWLKKSAAQGSYDAQYNLGRLYSEGGDGTAKTTVLSYALFTASIANDKQGKSQSQQKLDSIAKKMSAQEILDGQALSQELLKPKNFLNALDSFMGQNVPGAQAKLDERQN